MQAIETVYNGYRFRSRLEARWAVFFDAGGIEYQYEPEGFEHNGVKYLPDFYLPQFDTYVEIKPDRDGAVGEIEKAVQCLTWGGQIKRILILSDIPAEKDYDGGIWHFPCIYWDGTIDKPWCGWWFFFDTYDDNGDATLLSGHISSAPYQAPFVIWDGKIEAAFKKKDVSFKASTDAALRREYWLYDEERIPGDMRHVNLVFWESLKKARQARFEHGEKP